jgi:hypothetical protein
MEVMAMTKRVGTWWIRDGVEERRTEAQSFGATLQLFASFDWTQDHGDSAVKERDFIETPAYTEKVDQVDMLYLSTHGVYDDEDASTWGHAFRTSDGTVRTSESIDWGKSDLEYFATHACKLLYHSAGNPVWRWMPAFKRLHYLFGFYTESFSGPNQEDRGGTFASYAALHLIIPFYSAYKLRTAWKKACIETEGSSVRWAYLRASGDTYDGEWVSTYNEILQHSEPKDPVTNRTFYTANGAC